MSNSLSLDSLPTFAEVPEASTQFSPLQLSIFSALASRSSNLLVNAGPGSGKSHTARELARRAADTNPSVLMVAFNKAIADENASYGLPSSTWHSLGFSSLRRKHRGARVSDYATLDHLLELGAYTGQYAPDWAWEVKELSARLRAGGIGHTFELSEAVIADAYSHMDSFYDGDPEPVINWTYRHITERTSLLSRSAKIDFADMLYLPIELGLALPQYDLGIIDEAQDTDAFQLLYADRCFARTVFVGDPNQSIYAFRGADHSAMQRIAAQFACDALPLNVTYRCAQAIVDECNQIYPGLVAADPDRPGSLTRSGSVADYVTQSDTLILCRNNAPLINLASQMLRAAVPFTITSDFPMKLSRYIQKLHCKSVAELRKHAEHALEHEQKESAIDRWETILNLCNRYPTIDALLFGLKSLIGLKSPSGPLLSTIHKAKGLEADTTVLLRSDLLPSKFAKTDADLRQERNLSYVAVSRAKNHFIYA